MKKYTLSNREHMLARRLNHLVKMKLAVFIVFFTIVQVNASSFAQTVTIPQRDISLLDLFREIKKQTGYNVLCNTHLIKEIPSIKVNLKNTALKDALDKVLTPNGLSFTIENKTIVVKRQTEKPKNDVSRQKGINGKVTDRGNLPIPGVGIRVKGTNTATVTDAEGSFFIRVEKDDAVLLFSFIGYKSVERSVSGQDFINVTMKEETAELNEVVVVGYGTQTRKELTTAISTIKGEDLNKVVGSTISAALKGKATGVRVFNSSGSPGANASITIRGGSSINKNNSPLVLIDGLPGSFSNVPPQDVESVEILKDAASTAIYGARASNGIVLITTKSGKSGKPSFTTNFSYGYQQAGRRIERLNAEEFLSVVRPAIARSSYTSWLTLAHPAGTGNTESSNFSTMYLEAGMAVPAGWKSMPDPIDPNRTLIFEDVDVEDNVFTGGNIANVHISANGGTPKLKYMTSLGYTGDNGFVPMNDWKNLTLRSNFSYELSNKLTLNSNLGFTRNSTNAINNESDIFSRSIHLAPTLRSVMPDGSIPGGRDNSFNNPLFILDNIINKRTQLMFMGKMGLEWKVLDGLVAKVDAYYNPTYTHREYFQKSNIYNSLRPAEYYGNFDQTSQYEAVINYNKTFNNDHKFSALLGASSLGYNIYSYDAKAQGGSSDEIITLNAAPEYLGIGSQRQREELLSAFSRLSYSYKSKYLLSATMRLDGSSKFASGNRLGFFPGVSAGYVLSEEDFMKDFNWVNLLKLRASYGLTGNNAVGRYDYQGVWSVSNIYNGEPASSPSTIPNKALSWEHSMQTDIGLELGLFHNNAVTLSLDYYNKITNNLLFSRPLPNTSGFGNIESNIGKVKFYGYEASINTKLIQKSDLSLELGANFSYNMNRVLKLPENGFERNRIGGLRFSDGKGIGGVAEGERLNGVIGYQTAFIIDNEAQLNKAMYDDRAGGWDPVTKKATLGKKFLGDFEWQDRNGDGKITPDDQFVLGYHIPTTTGGLNATFRFKNLELYFLADYALGHVIYDRQISLLNAYGENGYISPTKDVLKAWQQPGDAANTNIPRFEVQDGSNLGQWNWYRTSNRNAYDGNYLAIREVKLSYSFSGSILKALNVSKLDLYTSGLNLYYFTKYPGYITEYSGSGRNAGDSNYPNPRIISLGLNLSF